jgi:hypothetical protein
MKWSVLSIANPMRLTKWLCGNDNERVNDKINVANHFDKQIECDVQTRNEKPAGIIGQTKVTTSSFCSVINPFGFHLSHNKTITMMVWGYQARK